MANFPFQRLQSDLAELIKKTPAGQRLPSEPDLAKQLGVSRATLREAMRSFETQGLIRRRQGSGTFVVGKVQALDSGLEVLESLETIAKRMGLEVSISDLNIESIVADEELSALLGVPQDAKLTRVRRVIRAESRPVAYLVDILPEEIVEWNYLINVVQKKMQLFNYKEIRTPIFEHTALFSRGIGESTDIVSKEMYSFTDMNLIHSSKTGEVYSPDWRSKISKF